MPEVRTSSRRWCVSEERVEAVVIRGVDYSESSRVITLFTPGRGRVAVMAKGARRIKSGAASTLDSLNHIEALLYWKDGRDVQTLGENHLISAHPGIKRDLDKSCFAALPAELVDRLARENAPSAEMFDAFAGGLQELETFSGDARTHSAWQVYRLLIAAGFEPSLDVCGACGADLRRAAGFQYASGAVCADCSSDAPLSQKLWAQYKSFAAAPKACPDFELERGGLELLMAYSSYHIERDFRSLRVIRQMYGAGPAL